MSLFASIKPNVTLKARKARISSNQQMLPDQLNHLNENMLFTKTCILTVWHQGKSHTMGYNATPDLLAAP